LAEGRICFNAERVRRQHLTLALYLVFKSGSGRFRTACALIT